MSISRRFHMFVLAGLLAAPLAAQQVHVVRSNGTGDFETVAAAAAAAASGDTILVKSGDHTPSAPDTVIVGKSLAIVGDSAAAPVIKNLIVRDLAADQIVHVRGLTVDRGNFWGGTAVELSNNVGSVWIEDCTLIGGHGPWNFTCQTGGVALDVVDSEAVTIVRCSVEGGGGSFALVEVFGCKVAKPGGSALRVENSAVTLHDCQVTGGQGGTDQNQGDEGGHGGAAIEAHGSSLVLSAVLAQGGLGGSNCIPALADSCQGGDGLQLDSGSVVHVQEGTFVAGLGGGLWGGGTAPPGVDQQIGPSDSVVAWSGTARSLQVPSPAREGDPVTITYWGEQGDTVGLFFSLVPGYLPLPGKQGVFALGSPLQGVGLVWTVNAPHGVFWLLFNAWPVTSLGLESQSVYGQCFLRDAAGNVSLSGPTSLTILADVF